MRVLLGSGGNDTIRAASADQLALTLQLKRGVETSTKSTERDGTESTEERRWYEGSDCYGGREDAGLWGF